MRSALVTLLLLAVVLPLAAQMGPQTGGPYNMMSNEVLAPAAGRGAGAFGSNWRTDLWVKGAARSTVTLEFHPADATSEAATATAQITLNQSIVYLSDVLKNTLGLEQAFGNIVLRSTTGVSATIRVYTTNGDGSYGAAFMAMPTSMALRGNGGMMDDDDRYELYVCGLLPQPRARANVMITNAGSTMVNGIVDILDADGLPANGSTAMTFSIRGYSSHQFNDVLTGVTSRFGEGNAMQVRVRLTNGSSGMVMAIASVVDNATNDTYTIMGSMMNGAAGMMP